MPTHSVIVDLEATCCDDNSFPRHEMEIIEIGAVAVESATGAAVSEFQSFVRPVRNRVLTDFCKSLTSISQQQVDGADEFPAVIKHLGTWLSALADYDFCSWGNYDRRQFEQDCEFHSVSYPFAGPHRNLKVEFAEALGLKKRLGVGQAVRKLGLEFDGTPHRGIDDARNIAAIYRQTLASSGS